MSNADTRRDTRFTVAIIGCGLMAYRRANAMPDDEIIGCYDLDEIAMNKFAEQFKTETAPNLESLLDKKPDIVLVCTPPSIAPSIAERAVDNNSHVLIEKPAAVSASDLEPLANAAKRNSQIVKVGFNHRFFPGISRAILESKSGMYGDIMFARARYGHGGRIGYESEWRANPDISGGGELIDQGVHILDLFHELLGPLELRSSLLRTNYWNMPVEDNAVITLGDNSSERSPWATFHVSCSEWKNMFSLEIYCEHAKFQVDGLAGSYGDQTLVIYKMRPEMGPPDEETHQFEPGDNSWAAEWDNLRNAILADDESILKGSIESARYAISIVKQAYSTAN